MNTAVTGSGRPLSGGFEANSLSKSLLVMSPVFKVSADPVISVALPNQEGVTRTDGGEQKHEEATGSVVFPLSADQRLENSLTVCLRVTESGGDRVASTNEGIQTATLPATQLTNGAGTYTLNWTDTAADDRDSSVTVELVAPGTAGCSGAGAYTVSTEEPSEKILIQDDESTTVSLTSSDPTMSEGDASDPATLTVTLSRRMYAGEIIAAPIVLATSTGARLPNHAMPDFTVSASGAGVSLVNATGTTPRVVFTGHDSNTVQTATVTLTPVDGRDDGDVVDETITATLTSLGVTGLETVISGGVAAHSSDSAATLMLNEPSEISVAMAGSDGDADGNAVEGAGNATAYRTITITLGRALTGSETVTVPLTVQGATVTTDYTFALNGTNTGVTLTTTGGTHTAQNPAVVFASGASSATLRLTPVNNNDRTQPYVVIDYGTGSRVPSGSGGVTLTTPTGGPIGIVLVDDETGDIEVPETWALKPSAVSAGNKFRLMYMTSEGGAATSSDIDDYDEFVRIVGARGGHQHILPYIGFFKTFGNTRTTTATSQNAAARGHVGMWSSGTNVWTDGSTSASSSGTPIYWLNGTKISDNYYDFCDNSWDNRWSSGTNHLKHEDGNAADGSKVWTGMANNCALHSNALGHASQVSWGPGTQTPSGGPLRKGQEASANTNRFYGMSPEFKVELPPVPPVPPKPTGFTATAGDGQVTLSWNDPNRSTITSWQYRQKAGSGSYGSFMTISGSSATTTSHTVTGLTNGVTYTFQVFAVASNAGGSVNGLPSDERTATPMAPSPVLTFGSTTYSGGEGSGTIAVTVNASGAPSSALTVNLTTANGSATGGTDFTAPAATFTFPASATSHTISVAITQDNAVESNETFTLTLTAGSGYTVGSPASTTVTITNDDTAPPPISGARGLALTPSQLYVVEGGNATFSARLTARPSAAVTVTVTSPNSEILLSSGAEGETPAQTLTLSFVLSQWDVPLPVVVSSVVDSDKVDDTATLSLTASGGGYGAVTGSLDVTVTDRQWARGWDFAKFFVHNTEPGDAILKYDWPVWEDGGAGFWVTRTNVYKGPTSDWYNAHTHGDVSHPAHKDTWINIPNPWSFKMCFGGTATLWVDYGVWTDIQFDGNCTERIELPGPTGPPEYRPGWDRKLFYLNVLDDNHEDSGETIVITLQDPQGVSLPFYFLGGETLTYTIHNDDPPLVPEALISHDTGPVTEGAPARFALLINPRPATPTDVTVKLTGAHGYLASDQSRTLTVSVPTSGFATFEVPTVGDNVRESDAKIIATVIKGDGYQPDRDPEDATASVTVQDDDPNGIAPMLSIAADAASIAEGGAARYTITADPKPNAPLRVSVTVSQDGDWGVKTGTRAVTIGSTGTAAIEVDTVDDTRYEPDGSVAVTIEDHYDYDLDTAATSATVAVTSDDIKLPQVSISDATAAETGRFIWFDITLDKPAANAVYVSMALDSGTAKYGDDFIRLASSVQIPAGQTSGRYEVYVFADNTPEGPETFTARIYRVSGGPAEVHATQGAATGTITDIAPPPSSTPEISIAACMVTLRRAASATFHHHRQPSAGVLPCRSASMRNSERRLRRNRRGADGNHSDQRDLHADRGHQRRQRGRGRRVR